MRVTGSFPLTDEVAVSPNQTFCLNDPDSNP
jgi:hypothetical protein